MISTSASDSYVQSKIRSGRRNPNVLEKLKMLGGADTRIRVFIGLQVDKKT